ncbi:DnaA N-terminal domain-containing protein, partial [Bartonella sp. AD328YNZD]
MVDKLNSKASSFKRVSVNILPAENIIKNRIMGGEGTVCKNASIDPSLVSEEEGAAAFVRVMAQLKVQVGVEAYTSWFGRVKLAEYSHTLVKLSVPTAFLRSWINNHYGSLLTHLWKQENSAILRVEVIVRGMERVSREVICKTSAPSVVLQEQAASSFVESCAEHSVKSSQTGVFGSPLDSRYTFESFVEGASNRVA